jgi:hypothetical protein
MPHPVSLTRTTLSPTPRISAMSTPPANRGKLDGVVDEVGDRLDQQVAIAMDR